MNGCCPGGNHVVVQVEYLDVDGKTCERCANSIEAASAAVEAVGTELAARGITVELETRHLDRSEIADSNRVLVNGRPVEEWVGGTSVLSECPSCSEMLDAVTCCRAVEVHGEAFESVPADAIVQATRIAAGLPPSSAVVSRVATEHVATSLTSEPSPLRVTLVADPACG